MSRWRAPYASLRASFREDADRWLLGAAALALAGSFMNPGVTSQRARFEHMVVIDVTQSMNVTDVRLDGKPVSRLGSKLGWAIFTEYRSYLLLAPVEVCANLSELRATLAQIDGRMAWSGNSEIAKGVHSGIGIAKVLPGTPSLVFITDGQEAPPLNPRYRPAFDDKPGEVAGLLVGVGDPVPSPIPKTDPEGRPIGFWRADDVAQTDPRSQGRGGSVGNESLVDDRAGDVAPVLGATPGAEHLSSLREGYLRLLAGEQGFAFHRLESTKGLAAALAAAPLARGAGRRVGRRAPGPADAGAGRVARCAGRPGALPAAGAPGAAVVALAALAPCHRRQIHCDPSANNKPWGPGRWGQRMKREPRQRCRPRGAGI